MLGTSGRSMVDSGVLGLERLHREQQSFWVVTDEGGNGKGRKSDGRRSSTIYADMARAPRENGATERQESETT